MRRLGTRAKRYGPRQASVTLCPLNESVVDPTPPAVRVRWVSIDDDRLLIRSGQRRVVVEVRPDIGEVLPRRIKPGF